MIKRIVMIASLMASGAVLAEDLRGWYKVGDETIGRAIYMNSAYIRPVAGSSTHEVKFWIKAVLTKAGPENGMAVGDYALTNFITKCSDRTIKVISVLKYHNGAVKDVSASTIASFNISKEPPPPNSAGEFYVKTVCSRTYPGPVGGNHVMVKDEEGRLIR